jgi:hypothetical protein
VAAPLKGECGKRRARDTGLSSLTFRVLSTIISPSSEETAMWDDFDDVDCYTPTTQDLVREWASQYGSAHTDQQWLLSDWDTWERNPHYQGPDQRHPEDYQEETEEDMIARCDAALDAYWQAEAGERS